MGYVLWFIAPHIDATREPGSVRMTRGNHSLLSGALCVCGSLFAAAPVFSASESTIGELKRLDVEDLMNIEVTSVARQPGRLFDAAAAIQVITREDIHRSGATTLPEALRLADNLQVAQRTSATWAISARGFNANLGNKLLVMIDGRTVYTPLFSGVFWEGQDYLLEDVERIEVISGPGGTLWGANAVNGVINVITRDSADSQGLHLDAAAGDELQALAGARLGGSLGSASYRIYGKYIERDAAVIGDGSSAIDDWKRGQGGFRIDSSPDQAIRYTLQGDYYSTHEQEPISGSLSTLQGANVLGRWTRDLAEDSKLSLQAYYDWTQLSDAVPAVSAGGAQLAPAGYGHDDLHTFDLDFQHQLRTGAHGVIWGMAFRYTHDVSQNAPGLGFIPERLDQQLYSAFVQDEIRLRDALWLTLGTKVEHNDYTGWEVEPSVRLRWQPAPDQTVWAAVSRAIRAPARFDRDLRQPTPPNPPFLYGSSDFRSEELLAWELGYRARPSDAIAFSLSAFYNDYDYLRSTEVTPPALTPMTFANGVAGSTWGVEFSGDLQVTSRWTLHLGYNLLEEDLHVKPGEIDVSDARAELADPEQQAVLRSELDLPGPVTFDASLRWVDTLYVHNRRALGTVPQYTELDVRMAWQATRRLELALVGQNLLHDHHPEYGFPGASRVEIQRSVMGTLTWRN